MPPQRSAEPHVVREVLDMTSGRPAEAWGSVVSGVHPWGDPNADWRWASEHSVFHSNSTNSPAGFACAGYRGKGRAGRPVRNMCRLK